MAKYRVETSHGVFEVEADHEPTLADVEAALAQEVTPKAKGDTRSKVESVAGNPYFPKINDRPIMSEGDPLEGTKKFAGHVADAGLEAGGGIAGQAVGAPLAPLTFGLSVPVGGAIGAMAGNTAAQFRRIKSGEQDKFSVGDLAGSALTGAIPGGPEIKGGVQVIKAGAKNVAANVGAEALRTGLDEHRLPNATEAGMAAAGGIAGTALQKGMDTGKSGKAISGLIEQDAAENAIISKAKEAGYVLPPSRINPNAVNAGADFLAGSDAVSNDFSLKNQRVTNKLARDYIQLPENATLNDANISNAIKVAKQPYDELRALSPQANANVDVMLQSRADANRAWKAYDHTPTPEILRVAKENDQIADAFHDELVREADAAGKTGMAAKIQKAREDLAKIHMVEQALGPDGNVSAQAFSRAKENGAPLTGPGVTIADTAYTFPSVTKNKRSIGTIGSGKVPILDKYVRTGMATDTYQDNFAVPRYASPTTDPLANFGRMGAMLFTQEDPETETARKISPAIGYLLRAGQADRQQ